MMNADERKLLEEIERDEAWLTDVLRNAPEPECRTLASIKHRVTIAVQENAIPWSAPPAPSEVTVARIKSSVRQALHSSASAGLDDAPRTVQMPSRPRHGWTRGKGRLVALVGLAAAAVLGIMVTPLDPGLDTALPRPLISASDVSGETVMDVFEEILASNTDFDVELMLIEEKLEDITDSLLLRDLDYGDSDLEDFEDDLDYLWSQSSQPFEV